MQPREVLLITRVRTLNKGNQALSAEWLAMLERAFPADAIRVLERRPRHLTQYELSDVARARDPYGAFDALTTKLARLAPGVALAGPVTPRTIELDESIPTPVRFVKLRRRLNLRGLVARTGRYLDEYKRRLSACQRARLVVVNPAGEFFPRDPVPAFYHLLDVDVARKLGRPTAIVNHTMDITDPTLREIIPRLYRSLDLVAFRDAASVGAFVAMGGDLTNVVVSPDLALATQLRGGRIDPINAIALAINVPEASAKGYLGKWKEVVTKLREQHLNVHLTSNELPLDRPFYHELQRKYPDLRIVGEGMGHEAYCRLLSGYDLVITSRMHTGILAMVSGTPVVPVEGSSFKITGLFRELGLETPVIRPQGNDWPQQVIDQIQRTRALGPQATEVLATKIEGARECITSTLVPRLQQVAHAR